MSALGNSGHHLLSFDDLTGAQQKACREVEIHCLCRLQRLTLAILLGTVVKGAH
jgi:hypothetical protein